MAVPFQYLLRVKVTTSVQNGVLDFFEKEQIFADSEPMAARRSAFAMFQNYVDVFLQNKGLIYSTDKEARRELESLFRKDVVNRITIGDETIEYRDTIGNGIGVFLVVNESIPSRHLEDEPGEEYLLHGIGHIDPSKDDTDARIFSLQTEYSYYKHFGYKIPEEQLVEIVYCSRDSWEEGYREDEPYKYTIIRTPFDWSGFDEPYWWTHNGANGRTLTTIQELIEIGENNIVEFKPALLYNFKTKSAGIGVKATIAKAICAFLNSNGGYLLVGVADDGTIQGLEADFSLANSDNPRDFFLLEYDQMLAHFFSFAIKHNISGRFAEVGDNTVFIVEVSPSRNRPVFMNGQTGKEFYVRGEASSQQLRDLEDVVKYCMDHWGKPNH